MSSRDMRGNARALLVVDVQNDFCEGGSLGVVGGSEVASRISGWLRHHHGDYSVVVASRDWHVDPGGHFSESPDFLDSWPVHCVPGTTGAQYASGLDVSLLDRHVVKGRVAAAYSAFEGVEAVPAGDELPGRRPLADLLGTAGVTGVDICGLATDYCVRATALDAVEAGLVARVLLPLTAGVSDATTSDALQDMLAAGVDLVERLADAGEEVDSTT